MPRRRHIRGGVLPDTAVAVYGKGKDEAQRFADDFRKELLEDNSIVDDDGNIHRLKFNHPIVTTYRAEPVYDSRSQSIIAPKFKEGFPDTHLHNPDLHTSMSNEYGLNRHASSTSSYTPFVSTTVDKTIATKYARDRLSEFPDIPVKIYTIKSPYAIDVQNFHKMLKRNQEYVIAGRVPRHHIVNTETYDIHNPP
jgi:hypothetical protein